MIDFLKYFSQKVGTKDLPQKMILTNQLFLRSQESYHVDQHMVFFRNVCFWKCAGNVVLLFLVDDSAPSEEND